MPPFAIVFSNRSRAIHAEPTRSYAPVVSPATSWWSRRYHTSRSRPERPRSVKPFHRWSSPRLTHVVQLTPPDGATLQRWFSCSPRLTAVAQLKRLGLLVGRGGHGFSTAHHRGPTEADVRAGVAGGHLLFPTAHRRGPIEA